MIGPSFRGYELGWVAYKVVGGRRSARAVVAAVVGSCSAQPGARVGVDDVDVGRTRDSETGRGVLVQKVLGTGPTKPLRLGEQWWRLAPADRGRTCDGKSRPTKLRTAVRDALDQGARRPPGRSATRRLRRTPAARLNKRADASSSAGFFPPGDRKPLARPGTARTAPPPARPVRERSRPAPPPGPAGRSARAASGRRARCSHSPAGSTSTRGEGKPAACRWRSAATSNRSPASSRPARVDAQEKSRSRYPVVIR